MRAVALLTLSDLFMTFASYGHLKCPSGLPVSWCVAFFGYCLQLPTNRYGYGRFTGAQLRTIQKVITLSMFSLFPEMECGGGVRADLQVPYG